MSNPFEENNVPPVAETDENATGGEAGLENKEIQEKLQEIVEAVATGEQKELEKVAAPEGADLGKWDKLKRTVAVVLLGTTAFACSAGLGVNKAEAGSYNRNPIVAGAERGVSSGLNTGLNRGVRNVMDTMFRKAGFKSESEWRQEERENKMMQQRVWREQANEMRRQAREIEQMEKKAFQEYSQDIKKAKTDQDLEMAKKKLDLRMEQVKILKGGGSQQEAMMQADDNPKKQSFGSWDKAREKVTYKDEIIEKSENQDDQ